MKMFWKTYLQGVKEYCFVKILTDGDHHVALQVLASNNAVSIASLVNIVFLDQVQNDVLYTIFCSVVKQEAVSLNLIL